MSWLKPIGHDTRPTKAAFIIIAIDLIDNTTCNRLCIEERTMKKLAEKTNREPIQRFPNWKKKHMLFTWADLLVPASRTTANAMYHPQSVGGGLAR